MSKKQKLTPEVFAGYLDIFIAGLQTMRRDAIGGARYAKKVEAMIDALERDMRTLEARCLEASSKKGAA